MLFGQSYVCRSLNHICSHIWVFIYVPYHKSYICLNKLRPYMGPYVGQVVLNPYMCRSFNHIWLHTCGYSYMCHTVNHICETIYQCPYVGPYVGHRLWLHRTFRGLGVRYPIEWCFVPQVTCSNPDVDTFYPKGPRRVKSTKVRQSQTRYYIGGHMVRVRVGSRVSPIYCGHYCVHIGHIDHIGHNRTPSG